MAPNDYKALLNLLRAHACHLPFQEFRTIEPETRQARERPDAAA
jgi:hypothetical protein